MRVVVCWKRGVAAKMPPPMKRGCDRVLGRRHHGAPRKGAYYINTTPQSIIYLYNFN